MVIGLNGRIPLNTAGNLAGSGADPRPAPGQLGQRDRPDLRPPECLRPYRQRLDPFNQLGNPTTWASFQRSEWRASTRPTTPRSTTRSTSRRTRLSVGRRPVDPAPQPPGRHAAPAPNPLVGDQHEPQRRRQHRLRVMARLGSAGAAYYLPNGIADWQRRPRRHLRDRRQPATPLVQRTTPPVAGRWGEAASVPGVPFTNPSGGTAPPLEPGAGQLRQPGPRGIFVRHRRPGRQRSTLHGNTPVPPRRGRRQLQRVRRLSRLVRDRQPGRRGLRPRLLRRRRRPDAAGRADAAVRDAGRHQRHRAGADVDPLPALATTTAPTTSAASSSTATSARPGSPARSTSRQSTLDTYPYGRDRPPRGRPAYSGRGPAPARRRTCDAQGETYVPDVTNNPFHGYEWYKVPNSEPGRRRIHDLAAVTYQSLRRSAACRSTQSG